MDSCATFLELYGRIPPLARAATDGLERGQLVQQVGPNANTIAWLIWHSARVEDHHVAELRRAAQVWSDGAWASRVGLEPDPSNTGYGHTTAEAGRVSPSTPSDLLDYLDAVQALTLTFLGDLSDTDLDAIVDQRWDPPVTLGVRLVSVADDALQHLGQAAYVRGLLLD